MNNPSDYSNTQDCIQSTGTHSDRSLPRDTFPSLNPCQPKTLKSIKRRSVSQCSLQQSDVKYLSTPTIMPKQSKTTLKRPKKHNKRRMSHSKITQSQLKASKNPQAQYMLINGEFVPMENIESPLRRERFKAHSLTQSRKKPEVFTSKQQAKQSIEQILKRMNLIQKRQLAAKLKQQFSTNCVIDADSGELLLEHKKNDIQLTEAMRLALAGVEKRVTDLMSQFPRQENIIAAWKNRKMHELYSAYEYLKVSLDSNFNSTEANSMTSGLQQEMALLLKSDFKSSYLQMLSQALLSEIRKNLESEAYPQQKQPNSVEVHKETLLQSYFTSVGTYWFLEKLIRFLFENQLFDKAQQQLANSLSMHPRTELILVRLCSDNRLSILVEWTEASPIIKPEWLTAFHEEIELPFDQTTNQGLQSFNKALVDSFEEELKRRVLHFNGYKLFNFPINDRKRAIRLKLPVTADQNVWNLSCKACTSYASQLVGLISEEIDPEIVFYNEERLSQETREWGVTLRPIQIVQMSVCSNEVKVLIANAVLNNLFTEFGLQLSK